MSIYCLVFTSVATRKVSDEDLKGLLVKSRQNNLALNITGMLLYLDPYFMQILEGDESIIDEKFKKILNNEMHHKVSLIYKKPIKERSFSKWTMGFNKIETQYFEGAYNLIEIYKNDAFKKHPKEVIELLEMFKDETLF
jgi:hypothetical protein